MILRVARITLFFACDVNRVLAWFGNVIDDIMLLMDGAGRASYGLGTLNSQKTP